jgi:hypothetical protein
MARSPFPGRDTFRDPKTEFAALACPTLAILIRNGRNFAQSRVLSPAVFSTRLVIKPSYQTTYVACVSR